MRAILLGGIVSYGIEKEAESIGSSLSSFSITVTQHHDQDNPLRNHLIRLMVSDN